MRAAGLDARRVVARPRARELLGLGRPVGVELLGRPCMYVNAVMSLGLDGDPADDVHPHEDPPAFPTDKREIASA